MPCGEALAALIGFSASVRPFRQIEGHEGKACLAGRRALEADDVLVPSRPGLQLKSV